MKTVKCSNCRKVIWWLRQLTADEENAPVLISSLNFCSRECAVEFVDSWREEQDARADELRKESALPDASDLD